MPSDRLRLMTTAPLHLETSFPIKIELATNLDLGEQAREINAKTEVSFAQNETDARQWQVTLSVEFSGKGAPAAYKGRVDYMGYFTVATDYPEEKMPRMVAITCPSMLYSAIRELVALLTGRGPHRPLMLPTVSFQDLNIEKPSLKV
jgi:preprotein translocase subunit SecB